MNMRSIFGPRCLLAALLPFVGIEANAQFYLGVEGGRAYAGPLDNAVSAVNHPTRCDVLLYSDPSAAPTDAACTNNTPGVLLRNSFDLDSGAVGGFNLGYEFNQFRVEVQYLQRSQGGERRLLRSAAGNTALSSKDSEWSPVDPPSEELSEFDASHLFLNAYRDFPTASDWTFFVGAGVGVAKVSTDYEARFTRKPDLGSEEWQQAASGTTSLLQAELSDAAFGAQVVGGVSRALDDRTSLDVNVRWTHTEGFTEQDRTWTLIRSHEPVQADGTTPFIADVEIDNMTNWAVTVGLRYRF